MARMRLVISDAEKAHEAHIRSYERGLAGLRNATAQRVMAERHAGAPRPVGTLHADGETDCPEGRPNCRNCGDPGYAAACQAAGHCPGCGTTHGIAPDSILQANGYTLEPSA